LQEYQDQVSKLWGFSFETPSTFFVSLTITIFQPASEFFFLEDKKLYQAATLTENGTKIKLEGYATEIKRQVQILRVNKQPDSQDGLNFSFFVDDALNPSIEVNISSFYKYVKGNQAP
jgi:hypothetical protein